MVDLQVIFPQEAVALSAVMTVPGAAVRTLNVLGKDFRFVDQVRVNDILAPNFIIVSRTSLMVEVPALVGSNPIQAVEVTSRQLTVTPQSVVQFHIGSVASKVSGILRLVQIYLKVLFTTPGTDIFSQLVGGDALRSIGLTFSKSQSGSIVSDFVLAVNTTNRQILAIQGRDPSVPADERLLSSQVLSATFDVAAGALRVSVEVGSQAGQFALANIVV